MGGGTGVSDDMTMGELGRAVTRIGVDTDGIRLSVAAIDKAVAVQGEKVDKLERIVYGACFVAGTALAGQIVAAVLAAQGKG